MVPHDWPLESPYTGVLASRVPQFWIMYGHHGSQAVNQLAMSKWWLVGAEDYSRGGTQVETIGGPRGGGS